MGRLPQVHRAAQPTTRKRNLGGWRKNAYWKSEVKNAKRACERIVSRGGPNKAERTLKAVQNCLEKVYALEKKVHESIIPLKAQPLSILELNTLAEVDFFHGMLIKHIDLVERRLVNQETIPHEEKVFSLFEVHTELIKKGKTMPTVEFGHRFLVSTDQFQLVVDYKVMEGGSEGAEIIPVVDRLLNRFGEGSLASLSTDKGFSGKEDRELLELFIDEVMMPKKGRKNALAVEHEREPRWLKLKDQHSEVESNINSLEHHGLERCPDKGLNGYKRYAGLESWPTTSTKSAKVYLRRPQRRERESAPPNKASAPRTMASEKSCALAISYF
ncbi:MAG: IS5 family transposase [Verrucomicrobiales bacterium]